MNDRKPSIVMSIIKHLIGLFLFGFLGYLLAGILFGITTDNGILNIPDKITNVLFNPFANHWNKYSLLFIFAGIGAWLLFAIYESAKKAKRYMPGKEYGDARFESAKDLNKAIADKDDDYNRIYSQNVRFSYNFKKLRLNGNTLIIGGSGTGKTFFEVKPNLMQMPRDCSFIITDPKGEVLRDCGHMLKSNGYNVRVLNLLEMNKSDRYNPFKYIRTESDVTKLITNLIQNTTPKGASKGDPFWEKAETMFLSAIFYYVWLEIPPEEGRNFGKVLELLSLAKVTDKGDSELDKMFEELAERTGGDESTHPAVIQYNKCMRGAGDTVRSIIISANARLATLQNAEVLRLLEDDDLDIAEIGTGVDFDSKTKTALFCLIPDNDKSYNFIIGMLYTQIFQELYFQADFRYGGSLPLHVTFMLDEFANVALPDGYTDLITTMRSRGISSIIIIQNIAQLKELFDKSWEKIPGNCDTLIYLGGNELSTWEDISKRLGKETINKMSSGQSLGKSGGSSRNYDVLGKELMMADQVGRIDNKKCILFVRGHYPVFDDKYDTSKHKNFGLLYNGKDNEFVYERRERGLRLLNEASIKYYERAEEIIDLGSLELAAYQMFSTENFLDNFIQSGELAKKDLEIAEDASQMMKINHEEISMKRDIKERRGVVNVQRILSNMSKDFDNLLNLFSDAFIYITDTEALKYEKRLREFKERIQVCRDLKEMPEFRDETGTLSMDMKDMKDKLSEIINEYAMDEA